MNQCRQSADLFVLSAIKGYASEDFITSLMQSQLGQYLYSKECIDIWLGAAYVMETLEQEITFQEGKVLPDYFMHWVGYLYRYWSLATEDTATRILQQAPIEDLRLMYQGLHVMSYGEVVNELSQGT